jgi:hypothetical protein
MTAAARPARSGHERSEFGAAHDPGPDIVRLRHVCPRGETPLIGFALAHVENAANVPTMPPPTMTTPVAAGITSSEMMEST